MENKNNDHNHEVDKMVLTLEDDTEVECSVVADLEVEGKIYIALLPDEEEQVLLYEYVDKEEDPELLLIENDEEFELVAQAYNDLMEEAMKEEKEKEEGK